MFGHKQRQKSALVERRLESIDPLEQLWLYVHTLRMSWTVLVHDDFAAEFAALAEALQDELLAHALLLRHQRTRSIDMTKKLDHLLEQLPAKRRATIEARADELATLKDLRQAVAQTQQDLAVALGVGQDTISRLEKRSDMLLSTLRRYVEAMGGKLELVAQFPNRPPVIIDHLAPTGTTPEKHSRKIAA